MESWRDVKALSLNVQQPQRLSGPGAERTDNASHPRGLLLPRAVPPAGKFSLRSIACLTLQGRRARDRRGPGRERPRKLGGRWRRWEEQAPYLGDSEWPAVQAGSAWGGEGAGCTPLLRPAPAALPPPPPLPPSRASCHGDQTCLCASPR